jgi:hypothetical protein
MEECYDTGEYETVYNCRVEGWHTYFVGCDERCFSVWAHNADYTPELRKSGDQARSTLRSSLGLVSDAKNPIAAHHLIPWTMRNGPT